MSKTLIAVASSDGIVVNTHFGRADKFYIYELGDKQMSSTKQASSNENASSTKQASSNEQHKYSKTDVGNLLKLLEVRHVEPVCNGGNHEEDKLERNLQALSDCQYLLVSRIGSGACMVAERLGIEPYEIPGIINESVDQLVRYIKLKALFNLI